MIFFELAVHEEQWLAGLWWTLLKCLLKEVSRSLQL